MSSRHRPHPQQKQLQPWMSPSILLCEVVKALVDHPDSVRVEEANTEGSTHLVIYCEPDDRGKIIGQNGGTVQAIRILFGKMAAIEGRKTYIQVAGSGPNSGSSNRSSVAA